MTAAQLEPRVSMSDSSGLDIMIVVLPWHVCWKLLQSSSQSPSGTAQHALCVLRILELVCVRKFARHGSICFQSNPVMELAMMRAIKVAVVM